MIGGLTFEHDAIMRLISERCQRLVVVVSQSFLNSPANKFFVIFAQALGIGTYYRQLFLIQSYNINKFVFNNTKLKLNTKSVN